VAHTAKPLTVEQILAWAEAHHARTGKWPHAKSGPVVDAPGETWNGVNLALEYGHRGLPGGDSLARLLNRHRPLADQTSQRWTPEQDKLVRTLPPQEAARQTGRTMDAVYTRRCWLGVHTARSALLREWTPAEDEMVRTLPAREITQRTGRSLSSVYVRRHRLGLGRR
jgi:hypothetical protein